MPHKQGWLGSTYPPREAGGSYNQGSKLIYLTEPIVEPLPTAVYP